jgi:hypothetical protein
MIDYHSKARAAEYKNSQDIRKRLNTIIKKLKSLDDAHWENFEHWEYELVKEVKTKLQAMHDKRDHGK